MGELLDSLAMAAVLYFGWELMKDGPAQGTAAEAEDATQYPASEKQDDGTTDATGDVTVNQDKIGIWAKVTAALEGWQASATNRPTRNNNPGNLVGHIPGSIGVDSAGFAIFATPEDGQAALNADLQAKANKYPNYSLLQISARYFGGNVNNIPADGNIYVNGQLQGNAITRAEAVAKAVGASINDTLQEVFA